MFAIENNNITRRLLAAALALGLSACASHGPESPLPTISARADLTAEAEATDEHAIRLSVLTYNIAGLPWPKQTGTRRAMARIAAAWPDEFEGESPHIVALQEAFVPSATRLPQQWGYAHWVRGPRRTERTAPLIAPAERDFRKARRRRKGEKLGTVVGSGLMVASDLAIISNVTQPFGRQSCAGYDCLSNKGVQLVEFAIPGMPEPLFVLNAHLNSGGASGVGREQALYAYQRQVREIEAFLDAEWRGRGPLLVVGDFNARGNLDRFNEADERILGELAHRYCIKRADRCAVTTSWDSDAPWMDTQDLQGFRHGRLVRAEPVGIRARFDSPRDGRMLSDHDGLEVTWELRWHARPQMQVQVQAQMQTAR